MRLNRDLIGSHESLTPREADIVLCLLERKSDQGIASELGVSIHTVKFHKKNIYSKWGVKRRVDAIAFYYQRVAVRHQSVSNFATT